MDLLWSGPLRKPSFKYQGLSLDILNLISSRAALSSVSLSDCNLLNLTTGNLRGSARGTTDPPNYRLCKMDTCEFLQLNWSREIFSWCVYVLAWIISLCAVCVREDTAADLNTRGFVFLIHGGRRPHQAVNPNKSLKVHWLHTTYVNDFMSPWS